MGAWGPDIFEDDLALDVRDGFDEMIGEGIAPEEATRRLVEMYGMDRPLDLEDEDPVFWMALAAAQWERGRLLESVRAKAIEAIDAGADVRRWEEEVGAGEAAARRAAAVALRQRLESPGARSEDSGAQ